MKYRKFIEDWFMIDAGNGAIVPFRFNPVQAKYYEILTKEHALEQQGIGVPMREIVLKARKEGFSSLILALFAADDILQDKPTQSQIISYKDDATKQFRSRYKRYVMSYFTKRWGVSDPKQVFEVDSGGELILRHNGARFVCGTASARTGERGGTLQKLHFSEAAFYPDSDVMTAKEIIEGTSRQVYTQGGWIFVESTANGIGNHYSDMWKLAESRQSRYKPRFFSWREFYSPDDFEVIKSEFTDKDMIRQEYPENPEEAFLSSVSSFTSAAAMERCIFTLKADKELFGWMTLNGNNYIEQAEIIKHFIQNLEHDFPHENLYIGIDVAKVSDSTVVTVLKGQKNQLNKGGVKGIAIDSTGVGDFLPDWFDQNTRWYVIPVKLSATQNDMMYKNLQAVINGTLTKLPELSSTESKEFWSQMTNLRMERKGSILRVEAPEGKHDDYADSWALAELCFTQLVGQPKAKRAITIPSPQDAVAEMLESNEPTKTIVQEQYE